MYFSRIPKGIQEILNENLSMILCSILDIILTWTIQRCFEGSKSWLEFIKYHLKDQRPFEGTNALFSHGWPLKDSRFERAFVKYPVKNPRYYITAVLMVLWESRSIFKSMLFRDPLKNPHQDLGLKLLEKIYFEESKTIFVVEFIKNPSKNSMKYLKEGFSKICQRSQNIAWTWIYQRSFKRHNTIFNVDLSKNL